MTATPTVNKSLVVIFATVGLDAVGIGLIFPILPRLLADVTHSQNIAPYIGIMAALYASCNSSSRPCSAL